MVGSLIFVLMLLGFALLMIAERVGLSAPLGFLGVALVLGAALLVLGLVSVTSRFARFAGGRNVGEAGSGIPALLARYACILMALIAFAPTGVGLPALIPGFVGGVLLAHIGREHLLAPSRAARMAHLLLGLAFILVVLVLLPPLLAALAAGLSLESAQVRLVFAGVALLVLLPGGALGAGRAQRLVLALALVATLVPPTALVAMASMERDDSQVLEMLDAVVPLVKASLPAVELALSGFVLGLAGGLAARGREPTSGTAVAFGLFGALIVSTLLVVLHLVAAEWLARIVSQRIVGLAPGSWPTFVFEPELAGWLRACGVLPVDPQAVVRACALSGPTQVPGSASISFLPPLSLPALALANRLPVLLGEIWLLLPSLLGVMGLLSVLHGAALAVSESVLFGVLNPSGLHSFRLAMARLSLLALVVGVSVLGPRLAAPMASATHALPLLLGGAAILAAFAGFRRPPDAAVTP